MLLWHSYGRTFARIALCFCTITILGFAENGSTGASPAPTPKHFDHSSSSSKIKAMTRPLEMIF